MYAGFDDFRLCAEEYELGIIAIKAEANERLAEKKVLKFMETCLPKARDISL